MPVTRRARPTEAVTPVAWTSPSRAQNKPHATIEYGGYVYIWDRAGVVACKLNPRDFSDITYFNSLNLASICDGGDGYLYGIQDTNPCALVRFNPADNSTTVVIASLVASLLAHGAGPSICADRAGNLYACGDYQGLGNDAAVLKITIGTWVVAATRRVIGFKYGHAINWVDGELWITGANTSALTGWWAKLNPATLADIFAPTNFAPGGGMKLMPTDDFTWNQTHLFVVSEVDQQLCAMAKISRATGAVTAYYAQPGGINGGAWTVLYTGGKLIMPQFNRVGTVAVFDIGAGTFSDTQSSFAFYGVNEIIEVAGLFIATTYSVSAVPLGVGGLVGRLNLGAGWNFGPYFDWQGWLQLPAEAKIVVGDAFTGVIQIGSVEAGVSVFGERLAGNLLDVTAINRDSGGIKAKGQATGDVAGGANALVDVVWTTPFPSENYVAVVTSADPSAGVTGMEVVKIEFQDANKISVRVRNTSGGILNTTLWAIAIVMN